MPANDEIMEIIKQKIERDEKCGEQVGGSGHLGFVSYKIKDVKIENSDDYLKVTYDYITFVETEFTYYPDNPPFEFFHKKVIFLDEQKQIVKEL